jgi:hypothetical protein
MKPILTPSNGNGAYPTRKALEAAGIRIVVGIPLGTTLSASVFACFWGIAQRGWPIFERGPGRTDVNRNLFAHWILETDYTHLMMLDTDHLHAPSIIERHAARVLEDPDRRVISGMHFRRGEPFDPLAFVFGPDQQLHPLVEWPQGCIEVHALGHGSLLVHRSVFETIDPPWWGYEYGHAAEQVYPTEDMYFCYLCRSAGIKLWVDTTISSPHLIENAVTEDVYRAWLSQHPEKIQEIVP